MYRRATLLASRMDLLPADPFAAVGFVVGVLLVALLLLVLWDTWQYHRVPHGPRRPRRH